MHATAALWAMNRGKHVYCQKPLTRTVWEAQELEKAAARFGVATQMGNQGYSNPGARECCEIIWNGDIGNVTEVHAWTDRPGKYWPQSPDVVPKEAPVPATLDWEVWQGGTIPRPYSPAYLPRAWRAFPDYGCGAVGDMACHIMGTPNMAMRLGAPTSVECIKKVGPSKYMFPATDRPALRFSGARQHASGQDLLARQPEGVPQIRRHSGRRIDRRRRQQRQPLHRRQRHGDHGLLRRAHAPDARREE